MGEEGPRWGHCLKFLEEPQKMPRYCSPAPVPSLVLTHPLGDGGTRVAVWIPQSWVMALLHQPCASRFLSGPSAPAGRRGRRRWRSLSTLTQRASQGPQSRQTVVRTRWHETLGSGHCGHEAGATMVGHWTGNMRVGIPHHGRDMAGDVEGCSGGQWGCSGMQWDYAGMQWEDAVERQQQVWGCSGRTEDVVG